MSISTDIYTSSTNHTMMSETVVRDECPIPVINRKEGNNCVEGNLCAECDMQKDVDENPEMYNAMAEVDQNGEIDE